MYFLGQPHALPDLHTAAGTGVSVGGPSPPHPALNWLFGMAPAWQSALDPDAASRLRGLVWLADLFVNQVLRSVGQVVFCNNPLTGACIVLAHILATVIPLPNPPDGFPAADSAVVGLRDAASGVVACASACLVHAAMGYCRNARRNGLAGFSAYLVGVALPALLSHAEGWRTAAVFGASAVLGAATVPLTQCLSAAAAVTIGTPAFTLPFNAAAYALMAGVAANPAGGGFLHFRPPPPAPPTTVAAVTYVGHGGYLGRSGGDEVAALVDGTVRGLGQVFLIDSPYTSLLVLAGMLLCSRIAAAMAVAGTACGTLAALSVGTADAVAVRHGVWGYSPLLTAVALGGVLLVPSWAACLYAMAAAFFAGLAHGAWAALCGPRGLPAMTVPFCLTTMVFLAAARASPRFTPVPPPDVTTPEAHLESARNARRVGHSERRASV